MPSKQRTCTPVVFWHNEMSQRKRQLGWNEQFGERQDFLGNWFKPTGLHIWQQRWEDCRHLIHMSEHCQHVQKWSVQHGPLHNVQPQRRTSWPNPAKRRRASGLLNSLPPWSRKTHFPEHPGACDSRKLRNHSMGDVLETQVSLCLHASFGRSDQRRESMRFLGSVQDIDTIFAKEQSTQTQKITSRSHASVVRNRSSKSCRLLCGCVVQKWFCKAGNQTQMASMTFCADSCWMTWPSGSKTSTKRLASQKWIASRQHVFMLIWCWGNQNDLLQLTQKHLVAKVCKTTWRILLCQLLHEVQRKLGVCQMCSHLCSWFSMKGFSPHWHHQACCVTDLVATWTLFLQHVIVGNVCGWSSKLNSKPVPLCLH